MKSNLSVIPFLVVATVISLLFFLKSENEETLSTEFPEKVALTVNTITPTESQWSEIITANGSIEAWHEAIVGADISGQRLIEVIADVGDSVEKGDVLARFNTEILETEYAELEANWIAAQSNEKRALTLQGSGAMSNQAIDNYVNQAAVARAQMEAKALELKYAEVKSPDSGVITSRNAMLGSVGSAGNELFRLIRQNRLEWRGELTAEQVAHVNLGQNVSLTLPNNDVISGLVRQIAPSFNSRTRLITVFVDIENGSAKTGMYAQGIVIVGRQVSLIVPTKSVVLRDGHYYVFVIIGDSFGSSVSMRKVQIGQTRGTEIQILDGLSNEQNIVLQGAGFLKDGDRVRVLPDNGGDK